MKKRSYFKIKISFSFVIFIGIGLFFNAFNYLFIFYLLALVHELCHVLIAILFKVKVKELTFHALGFSAELIDVEFQPFYKQILIYFSGPLSFFPSLILINYLYKINLLSIYSYKVALNDNFSLLIFNMLPFYPLDGGHIMESILLKITDSFKAKCIRSIISFFVSIILLSECIYEMQYILFVFIFYNAFISLIFIKKEYHYYLINRVGKVSSYPIKDSIYPKIYHFYYNFFNLNNRFISEDDYFINEEINTMAKRIKRK